MDGTGQERDGTGHLTSFRQYTGKRLNDMLAPDPDPSHLGRRHSYDQLVADACHGTPLVTTRCVWHLEDLPAGTTLGS
jgi:hypothetical protein